MNIAEKTRNAGRIYECLYLDLVKHGYAVKSFDLIESERNNKRGIVIAEGNSDIFDVSEEKIGPMLHDKIIPRYLSSPSALSFYNADGVKTVVVSAEDERREENKYSVSVIFEQKEKSFLSGLFGKLKR